MQADAATEVPATDDAEGGSASDGNASDSSSAEADSGSGSDDTNSTIVRFVIEGCHEQLNS